MTRFVSGLEEIAAGFDAFVIDQFGVIHDGRQLYPEARAAMEALKAEGKRTVILTNSGKRREANRRRIVAMGIDAGLFAGVLSSGDVAYDALASGNIGRFGSAMIIGKHGEDYAFDSPGMAFVADPSAADLLLILGSDAPRTSLEDYAALLASAARRAIPAICCNPDREMLTASGLQPAPGAIAALYEKLGGKVSWVGKPYPGIYDHALRIAGHPDPARTLCIGDSLDHDVKGGAGAGLKTALVRTGIAARASDADIAAARPAPDFVLPSLRWPSLLL
jgi:HAD superfamily hydrolase (TIGR01459 family)